MKAKQADDILSRLKVWRRVNFTILLLLGAEAVALQDAFAGVTSLGIVARLIIAVSISAVTYFLVKFQVAQTRKIPNRIVQIAFFLGMTTLAMVIFFMIASMRMQYLEYMNPDLASRSSTFIFAGISIAFYLGTLFATAMYMVTDTDRKRALDYQKCKEELALKQKEFSFVSDELESLPQEREDELYECYSLLMMAEKYLLQVDHAFSGAIGDFILHNNLSRHDGQKIGLSQYKSGNIPSLQSFTLKND